MIWALSQVFALWESSLCKSVEELREKGQAALDRQEQQEDVSAADKDRAMKLLARAIQIAEAAAGSEAAKHLSAIKQIMFNMTEASGARPEKDQCTALFEQAGMSLFPGQVASPPLSAPRVRFTFLFHCKLKDMCVMHR